jgi:hypothetical protein
LGFFTATSDEPQPRMKNARQQEITMRYMHTSRIKSEV